MATRYISPGVYEIDGVRVQSPDGTRAGAEAKYSREQKARKMAPAKGDKGTKTDTPKPDKTKTTKDKSSSSDSSNAANSTISVNKVPYEESKATADKILKDSMDFGGKLREDLIPDSAFEEISTARSPDEQAALDIAKNEYTSASTRSPDAVLALDKFREALKGLDSQESIALREGARVDLDREYQAKQNQARAIAIKSGARGGAVAAQAGIIARDRAKAQKELSRDFVLKNVDLKSQALNNFGGYVRGLESDEASRRQAASQGLSTQTNVQTDRDLGKQQFNIGQRQNKVNANLTATLGGAGIAAGAIGGQQATDAAYENVRSQLELAKKQLEESQKQTDIYAKSVGVNNGSTKTPTKKKTNTTKRG